MGRGCIFFIKNTLTYHTAWLNFLPPGGTRADLCQVKRKRQKEADLCSLRRGLAARSFLPFSTLLNATFPRKFLPCRERFLWQAVKPKCPVEKSSQILAFFTSPCSLRFVHLCLMQSSRLFPVKSWSDERL
jgi:hypothetical protein